MNKTIIITALAAMTTALGANAQDKQLTILHTNDTHSCIMPLSENLADTMLAGRGGYVRRAALVKEERRQCPGALLFDSGDFSQGSPYYTIYKGEVEVGLMNIMQYDAALIGNHEFDFGLDNMARIFRMARFPIISSNYDFSGTVVEGLVKPYTVIRRNGMKIGVMGVSPKMDGLVFSKNCTGVKYINPVEAANKVARILKEEEKCDLIICLSHLGWSIGGMDDNAFIPQTHNIDILLGGHSHTYLKQLEYLTDADGRRVAVSQNGKNAVFVGKMVVEMGK